MNDQERAAKIVREVFLYDLKGEVGHLARLSVPLEDRRSIEARLRRAFAQIREEVGQRESA